MSKIPSARIRAICTALAGAAALTAASSAQAYPSDLSAFKECRHSLGFVTVLSVVAWLVIAAWAPGASAFQSDFTANCVSCHDDSASSVAPYSTDTCAGCHAHGTYSSSARNDINVTSTPDSATYTPGDPINVDITGGYRPGWVRVQMWDQDCTVAGACTQANPIASESLYTSGTTANFPRPVTLNATAPTTPGSYTWYAGWYGHEFDTGSGALGFIPDANIAGHGNQLVAFSFTVAGPANTPPVAVDDTGSMGQNAPVSLDVVANDNDVDGDALFVHPDYDTSSVNAGTVACLTGVTTPAEQCTYTPAVDFCGNDSFTYRAFDGIDASANRATVSIQVGDSAPPVVTAPTPDPLIIILLAGTDPGTTVPSSDPAIADWLALASATDPQDGSVSVKNNAPADFPVGDTLVTFTATDSCQNRGSAQATVSIQIADNSIPVVTAPTPLTITAPLCATSVPQTDAAIAEWLALATAEDPEDGPLPVTNDAPVDFPLGDTRVTFSATDSVGAIGTDTSTVTVNETPNTEPVVTAPPALNITVPNGTTSLPATDPTIAAWLASATADDAEDGALTVSNDAPADFPVGTTTVSFSATDACGLHTTATSTVTIIEVAPAVNNPPELTAPTPLTVTGALCTTSIPATDDVVADWLASATATDIEDGDLTAFITNNAPANFPASMAPGTATTVTFSVTDDGDPTGTPATTTATSTLTAVDPNTAPTVTAPAPLSITVPAGTTSLPATDPAIAGWLASGSAADAEHGTLTVNDNAPADFPLRTTTVTFTATDACGVSDTAVSTVTIVEESVADVWVTRMKVPKKVNGKVEGTRTKAVTVRADGDTTQEATVTLSVMNAPGNVTVAVTPASITQVVEPGKPETQFRSFTVSFDCTAVGSGVVTLEASIEAAQNADPTNDILTGTSSVTCR